MCNIAVFAAIGNNNDQAPEVATQAGEDTQDKSQVKQEAPDEAVVDVDAGNGYITYGGEKLDGKSGSFKAPYDKPLTLTASANEGYKLESVTVTGGGQTKTFTGGSITIPAGMVTNGLKVTLSTAKDESATPSPAATPIDGDKSNKAGESDQKEIGKEDEDKPDTGKTNNLPEGTETEGGDNSGTTDESKPETPKADNNSSATTPEQNVEGSGADQNNENSGATEGEGNGGFKGFIDGVKDVGKDLFDRVFGGENAEEADVKVAAAGFYTEVNKNQEIKGTRGYDHSWKSSDNNIAVVSGYRGSVATVTGKSVGTATITHTYLDWGWKTETFTVVVTPATPIGQLEISGDDSVTQFETITLTTNAKTSVTWTSSDREIATVDQSGKVKGIAQGEVTIVAETTDVDGTALRAEKAIAVTPSTDNISNAAIFFLNSPLANPKSNGKEVWFPSGGSKELWGKVNLSNANWDGINTYDNVANRVVSWPEEATGTSWVLPKSNEYWTKVFNAYKSKIGAELGVTLEESDVEAIVLHPYKISDNTDGIHLDCTVEMKTKGVVTATFMLWNAGATGYAQYGNTIPYKVGTGESAQVVAPSPELDAEKTVDGVKYKLYGWYSNEALTGTPVTFPVSTTSNVTYYAKYVPADRMITVNYYKEDTTEKVANSKVIDGLVSGQTVTENAIAVDNYTALEPTSQTVTAGKANEINFYYSPKTTSYTVHYYWNGSTKSVYPDKMISDAVVGDGITESPEPVEGYTPVSNESQTIEKLKADGNVITFYYYKNVALTANSGTATYDGIEHSVSGFTGAPEGADFSAIKVGASGTNADTYVANFPEGTVNTVDANGKYIVTSATDGSLVINKRSVNLSSKTANKIYDSKPLTRPDVAIAGDGFVGSEVSDIKATGTVTDVKQGKVKNTITYTKGEKFNEKNYTIVVNEGELWIDPVTTEIAITITGHKGGHEYDGTEKAVSGYDISGLPAGVSEGDVGFNGTAEVKQIDAGTYPMGLDSNQFCLKSPAVENYKKVTYNVIDGELAIAKRSVTLKSADLTKEYDGTPLANGNEPLATEDGWVEGEGATYTFTGSQTIVGESDNTFACTAKKGTNLDNYAIMATPGKLKVTNRTTKFPVTVKANSATVPYDGDEHAAVGAGVIGGVGYTFEAYGQTYTIEGLTTSDPKSTDACVKENTITGTAVVKDADRNVVTDQFDVTTENGKLTISKRVVTIKPKNATKVYDGNPLVATEWEYAEGSAKFVGNQGIDNPQFAGSQTAPGTSNSSIKKWGYTSNTNEDNYDVRTNEGTLTVTSRGAIETITVKAKSAKATYDGSSHAVKGLETSEFTINGKKYTVSGLETQNPEGTDAGTYPNNITGTAVVTDVDGKNVTSEFKVETENGALVIDRAAVTIKPKDAQKVYDRTALVATEFETTGLVGGDNFTDVTYGGSRTEVGTSDSSIIAGYGFNGNLANYAISEQTGKLTVTPVTDKVTVTITEHGGTVKYDGNLKAVEGYDVAISNQLYIDGDFKFTGNDKVEGTDADTYNMELEAANFENTNANFTSVEFVIVDGTLVIEKRSVKLTSASDEKVYDGKPLTNDTVTVSGDGFADNEGATYNVTGSQTVVGKSDNKFTCTLNDGTKAKNYRIECAFGTLEVTSGNPKLVVTKEVTNKNPDNRAYALDEAIEYKVTVKNIGDVPVKNVVVNDSLVRLADSTIDELKVNESKVFTYSYVVTVSDIVKGYVDNEATAEGLAPKGGKVKAEPIKVRVNTVAPNAHLKVTKKTISQPANQNGYVQGETIEYEVTVKNVGNMPAVGIKIDDLLPGVKHKSGEASGIQLAPGWTSDPVTYIYTVTAQDVSNGMVTNEATATGETYEGLELKVDPGTTQDPTYNPPAPTPTYENPSMVITKTASITSGAKAGDTITYNVTVRNNGDCDLTNVSIVDPLTGDKWNIDKLAVNATQSFTTQPYTVTTDDMKAGQVVNTATGTADNPTGKPTNVTPGTATTYIDKINASWTIDKSVTSTPANGSFYKKGESISYQIVVTNTGNVDLTDIELKDSLVNLGAQGSIDKLAPGESRTITYDYKVTAADVSKGKVVNSVTGTATGPDPVKPGGDRDDVNTGEDNPRPAPTPAPSGDNTNPVAPGGGNGGNGGTGGNVVTPTTPVAPVTPGMTETPSGETPLDANETPLAPANADVHCWVHWWIIVFMLLTLVYGCAVLIRRNGNSRELQEQQDRLLRKDDEQAQR